ncbi:dTDP-4-dehydrorhamnose 3,5-epimerase [Sphingosinicella humi]|uniref:dTDP-4-dehydrorhamnose 3,5-epimerase n=1 Tax=Allosphingosinicella humi TaxID=2068657 RepID=A0A2U2J554_9SPHN|nr:dTDP-4-dehydrorhamnose 3,5-epimerase [Sphingosinicella humi]PWG03447.1 dTDP-4-dehydrorhamnose 3,5-epimerase [Sphingosinicella humi]
MKLVDTALPEVKLVEPKVIGDCRGFFLESWNAREFAEAGLEVGFVQDNHSRSAKGVLRGLHYQVTQVQGKLIRVVAGRVFDVVVDLRRSSPGFGQWVGVELSAQNMRMLWCPPGFAHGFLVLEDGTDVLYKCTDYYAPEHERTLLWNDDDVGIEWPLAEIGGPVLSAKDAQGARLCGAEVFP